MMADQGGGGGGGGGGGNSVIIRDYRKGNWTVNETMVLIEAKRMDDERRMKRSSDSEGRSKPAELRWKWVEDYCWRKGCFRSQNQCNDKWDNLMRDYKKVRDYERRVADGGEASEASYWKLEKNERKDRNLPSSMLLQIYEALVDVVEKRGGAQRMVMSGAGGSGSSNINIPNISDVMIDRSPITTVHPPLPPLLQHHQVSPPIPALPLPPPPPPPPPQPAAPPQPQPPPLLTYSQPLPTVGTLSFLSW